MIRFVFMAALFGALGAGGASVDWRDQWDHVQGGWDGAVELWNAPGTVVVADFFYYRQCNNCYNLWHDIDRACCAECGGIQFTESVRARKIEYVDGRWRGYQTPNGRLYIHADSIDWFSDQFIVGNDVYLRIDAIIAKGVKLK